MESLPTCPPWFHSPVHYPERRDPTPVRSPVPFVRSEYRDFEYPRVPEHREHVSPHREDRPRPERPERSPVAPVFLAPVLEVVGDDPDPSHSSSSESSSSD